MKLIISKIVFSLICFNSFGQTNWATITDTETGITFSSPNNTESYNTEELKLFASEISTAEAIQVHICNQAEFDASNSFYQEALTLEKGDELRAMARIILLTSNSELTSIEEITTNGKRGIEMGIVYTDMQSEIQFYSFIRYYFINRNFVSFTWTGNEETALNLGRAAKGVTVTNNKNSFFGSVNIK